MKKTLFLWMLLWSAPLFAQNAYQPAPASRPATTLDRFQLPLQDNEMLREQELQRRAPGVAPHFATPLDVDIQPATHGYWENLADGRSVWRLRLYSKGAYSLNLGFSEYQMPAGGHLILYDLGQEEIAGPFTPADNESHRQLWTPLFPGEEVIIEVVLPTPAKEKLALTLAKVNHDFMNLAGVLSGSCNLDVACGAEDGWSIVDNYRDIIASVGLYTATGIGFCTGFLINNTAEDCLPYVVSGFHCDVSPSNASSIVMYWNYENQSCREPGSPSSGGPGDGPLNIMNSGAIYRAGYSQSDMVLFELDDPVPDEVAAFYAGWVVDIEPPSDTVIAIHHPDGEEKRISFAFDGTYRGAWGSGASPVPNGNHLIVSDWAIGTTEAGSSGCPLFNNKKQVVGHLHGGQAACGNNAYDSFGWFYASWTGGGTPSTSLRPWLDPDNTGVTSLAGRAKEACGITVTALPEDVSLCVGESVVVEIALGPSFLNPANVSVSGLPVGVMESWDQNPVSANGISTLTLEAQTDTQPGTYLINIQAGNGTEAAATTITLAIATATAPPMPLSPADGTNNLPDIIDFFWTAQPAGARYDLEISTSADFSAPFLAFAAISSFPKGVNLETGTTYYWRVRQTNGCGTSEWSSTAVFATADLLCETWSATDLPLSISASGFPTVVSELSVTGEGTIASVRVLDAEIDHSWLGDLRLTLVSPGASEIALMDRPGFPDSSVGCNGDDLLAGFDDNADQTAITLENTCTATVPMLTGLYQPITPLGSLFGEPLAGDWALIIEDNANGDGGSLNRWNLEICTNASGDRILHPASTNLQSCGSVASLDIQVGSDFDSAVMMEVLGLPDGVAATFSINPVPPGESVTLTLNGDIPSDTYWLSVVGTDGTNIASAPVAWRIEQVPVPFALLQPADGIEGVSTAVILSWEASAYAQNYFVEIAADPAFQDVLWATTTRKTVQSLPDQVFPAVLFWRVRAQNDCGVWDSEIGSFTLLLDRTLEVVTEPLNVFPNPTTGQITLVTPPEFNNGQLVLFNTNGQIVFQREGVFGQREELNLAALPSGVYWLRLTDGVRLWRNKVVVQGR
jgi:subtilisin-like proprotein convertase family protein